MKYFSLCILFAFISFNCISQNVDIIPQPASIKMGSGKFIITKNTVIAAQDENDRKTAVLFNDYLQQVYGFQLDIDKQEGRNYIRLSTKKFIKAPDKDRYRLTVTSDGIHIEGDTYAATFYGMQTLIQLLPVEGNRESSIVNGQPAGVNGGSFQFSIPFLTIEDEPRFKYRGMHLDVSRHFFPVSYLKKYIDYLALHKLNYFHWHLTDDQGWRIEIKKYPELQTSGAWRNGTIIGRYPGTGNDNMRYGGFYTQEEAREIVKYAAERHITVIPEIEMPGHASAAIATYPWLSCFPGEPTKIPTHPSTTSVQQQTEGRIKLVQETWGVFEDIFCAGKDSTFLFLQDVIDEVLTIFPSNYIHIGGDEAPKVKWKSCPNCQARIKAEGLKDEHELQSYFVQRMEKYLNSKGRTIIGWDEILEGGLAPNAIVMSWRGEEGGIEAAKQDHYVIMTPQKPLYFDHTQTRNEDSVVIGGYNPIEEVYAYDPIPKELPKDKERYILGAQANLWAEYIKYPSKIEYHVFPRMSALSEVLWSPKAKRDWKDFEKRLVSQFKRYKVWKANSSKAYFDLKASISPSKNYDGVLWQLESKLAEGKIRYQFDPGNKDGFDYDKPIKVTNTAIYTASLAAGQSPFGNPLVQPFYFNKATGKKVSITKKPNEKYPGQSGTFGLVNGVYSHKGLSHPDWIGWLGDDMIATIDLRKTTSFDSVRIHTLDQNGSWIYLPQVVEVFVSSDGKTYKSIGKSSAFRNDTLTMGWITVPVPATKARYIKVVAKNYGLIPLGKPGGGTKAWLFADEIQVF